MSSSVYGTGLTRPILVPTTNSDPSLGYLDNLISFAESELEQMVHQTWRVVSNIEVVNPKRYEWPYFQGRPRYKLKPLHGPLRPKGEGDKVQMQLRDGAWEDVLDSDTDWNDTDSVINVYVRQRFRTNLRFRIIYKSGYTEPPPWVKQTVLRMVAIELYSTAWITPYMPSAENADAIIKRWQMQVDNTVKRQGRPVALG